MESDGIAGIATNYGVPQPMSSMAAQEIQKSYGYSDKRDSQVARSRSGLSKAGMHALGSSSSLPGRPDLYNGYGSQSKDSLNLNPSNFGLESMKQRDHYAHL